MLSKHDAFFNRHSNNLHLLVIMLFFVDTNKKIINKYRMRTGQFGAEPQLYSLSNNEMHLFSLSHVCCMLHDNHCRLSLSRSSISIYSIIFPGIYKVPSTGIRYRYRYVYTVNSILKSGSIFLCAHRVPTSFA